MGRALDGLLGVTYASSHPATPPSYYEYVELWVRPSGPRNKKEKATQGDETDTPIVP